jgi:trehalose-phosphatase
MAERHEADALADEVARAARRPGASRTIVLDVDGTLAPIAPVPEAARVPEETLAALRSLVEVGWTVVLVSGRSARETRAMVRVPGVRVFGSHGLEGAGDSGRTALLSEESARQLSVLAAAARALASGFPGARVELKPAGMALHDRQVPRHELPRWKRALRRFLERHGTAGFETLRGRRVVELRPRGASKGSVLRALAPRGRRRGFDASLVAVGDDTTDEDMFRELQGRGLAVRAGRRRGLPLATRTLPAPSAVRKFLERLVDSSQDAKASGRRAASRAALGSRKRIPERSKP